MGLYDMGMVGGWSRSRTPLKTAFFFIVYLYSVVDLVVGGITAIAIF